MMLTLKDRSINLAILAMALFLTTAVSIGITGRMVTWWQGMKPSFVVTDYQLLVLPTTRSRSIKVVQTVDVTRTCPGNFQLIIDDASDSTFQRETFPAIIFSPGKQQVRHTEYVLHTPLGLGRYRLEANRISFCPIPGDGNYVEISPFPLIEFEVKE